MGSFWRVREFPEWKAHNSKPHVSVMTVSLTMSLFGPKLLSVGLDIQSLTYVIFGVILSYYLKSENKVFRLIKC